MKHTLLVLMMISMISSCQAITPKKLSNNPEKIFHIIPKPVKLVPGSGYFKLQKDTKLVFDKNNSKIADVANLLEVYLADKTPTNNKGIQKSSFIILDIDSRITQKEGYSLQITQPYITITANNPTGLFYGVQTLIQIINFDTKDNKIPTVDILDYPRFEYRGLHLDVCRHFFPTEFIKKYIDLMSKFKFNRFHWHLTEDQGWRIEIKKYPKLTSIGAFRDSTMIGSYNAKPRKFDKTRYGGFYTQEEVKEIVKYAAKRHVVIVPEIELPGHSQAALAAYPELACTDGPFGIRPIWGISNEIYCPKEETFQFLEDVLTEVIDLFPGEYIHIGGDEAPKLRWKESQFCQDLIKKEGLKDEHELQSYFIRRIEKFVNSKGRKIIGWDEILEGGLAPNAAVMSWRGEKGGIEAAKQHHDVVMTPGGFCYFDHYQSLGPNEPHAIGGYTSLEKVYSYNPVPPVLNFEEAKYIKGAQGNLWSEYIPTTDHVEYMVYPRAIALAEVVWTPQYNRQYKDFVKRLLPIQANLKNNGVNIANHLYEISAKFKNTGKSLSVELITSLDETDLRYTLDGTTPSISSPKYKNPFEINTSSKIKVIPFLDDIKTGLLFSREINIHKAAGKIMTLKNMPHSKYNKGGANAVINGIQGSDSRYSDEQWLGFNGEDFEGVINLGESTSLKNVTMRFYSSKGAWIYPPKEIEIYSSNDNKNFEMIGGVILLEQENNANIVTLPIKLLSNSQGKYLKIIVKRHGIIQEGKQGGGHEAWLFVDEIVVE